jgi:hypothetical protein
VLPGSNYISRQSNFILAAFSNFLDCKSIYHPKKLPSVCTTKFPYYNIAKLKIIKLLFNLFSDFKTFRATYLPFLYLEHRIEKA